MKLVRLIKMYLNGTHSKVCIGKNISEAFPVQNGLQQGHDLLPMLYNFALEYTTVKVQENQTNWN
jgi:hypothetical protein